MATDEHPIPWTLPGLTAPVPTPKPQPVDVALGALGEVAAELLAGDRPSRFAEIQQVMHVAQAVQQLRPADTAGVADMGMPGADGIDDDGIVMMNPPVRVRHGRAVINGRQWHDGADLNTQLLMMAQNFLKEYMAIEKAKTDKPALDVRLDEVTELSELYMLRLKLAGADQDVPAEVNSRIEQLLKRIGAPPHGPDPRPEPSTLFSSDSVRRHQADGAGQPDGDRVGEPLAE